MVSKLRWFALGACCWCTTGVWAQAKPGSERPAPGSDPMLQKQQVLQAIKLAQAGQLPDQPEGAPGSNCCSAHAGTGCDCPSCQAIVCGADPFCCNTAWDGICAGEAQNMCGGLCAGTQCNNNCADAFSISDGTTTFHTTGATTDGPSPCGALGNDIWYRYTATCTGALVVSLCGSSYDTVVAVYNGCTCPAGAALVCNDDFCGVASAVALSVTSGNCYLIQVGGFAGQTGSGTINITCNPASNCCVAHGGTGCDCPNCQATVCGADSFCCNVAWDGICAGEAGGMCGALCGGAACNDICAGAVSVCGGSTPFNNAAAATNGAAGAGCPQAFGDVWFQYAVNCNGMVNVNTCGSSGDTVLYVYAGCGAASCPPGAAVACNDDSCGLQSSVSFPGLVGQCYTIRVGSFGAGDFVSGNLNIACTPGTPPSTCCFAHGSPGCDNAACQATVCGADAFCCNTAWDGICAGEAAAMCGMLCAFPPPANDNCGAAANISNGSIMFSTFSATTDGVAGGGCPDAANDIWYNYIAQGAGMVMAELCGSSFDTVLYVYDGCACPVGALLACNDDSCGLQSQVSFMAAGTASCYKVRVGGFSGETGVGMLNIMGMQPPVTISAGNPPNLHLDPLQPGPGAAVTQGIGAAGTFGEGTVNYAPITVTFSGLPVPPPTRCNTTISCTGGACPTISSVTTVNPTTFEVNLSGAIPPLNCTTITFPGGQKLKYLSHPGNVNGDPFSNTIDLLSLVQALNNGSANQPANISKYDVDRSHMGAAPVNTQDLLREVQLLNGTNTNQVYNGTTHAACPP